MLPMTNVKVNAIFNLLVVCSFHVIGMGSTSNTTSVTILGNEAQMYRASLSMQCWVCTSRVLQAAENGSQAARFAIDVAMAVQIMMPAVM